MSAASRSIELSCPAKVNLSLAVTGRRDDGFHDLHSVVAQLELEDTLRMTWDPQGREEDDDTRFLRSDEQEVGKSKDIPERDNTVFKAVQLFRQACKLHEGSIRVEVVKRIPTGAGLGGGSSDAVAALKSLEKLLEGSVPGIDFHELSAAIGSDCPLFYVDAPVIMEGRGDCISELNGSLASRFRGKSILLFKPTYSINTAEAYRRMAARRLYSGPHEVEAEMLTWAQGAQCLPPRRNDFERVCSIWIPDLPLVLRRLREIHGFDARLSGSGSSCFLVTDDPEGDRRILEKELVRSWGSSHWLEVSGLK